MWNANIGHLSRNTGFISGILCYTHLDFTCLDNSVFSDRSAADLSSGLADADPSSAPLGFLYVAFLTSEGLKHDYGGFHG